MKRILKNLLLIINKPELRILPGQVAYSFVLSIIPMIVLVGFISSFFSLPINTIVGFLQNSLPNEVVSVLKPFLEVNSFNSNIILVMIVGFFIASNGAHAIIIASNTLYQVEDIGYFKRRIKAMIMTIIIILLFIFILVVLAFGNLIIKATMHMGLLGNLASTVYFLFNLLKWPIAFLVVFLVVKFIYAISVNDRNLAKYMNKGSLFTTLGFILITAIYSYYVTNFANYNLFYGNLSNIIVLMIWIYFLANIFVIGIAINYEMAKNSMVKSK